MCRGRDHLALISAHPLDLFQQKHIGRLGDGDGENALHQKQRQNLMFFQEFLGERGNHLRIGDTRADPRIRHAIRLGQRLGDLVFGAKSQLDQHLTQ